MSINHHPDPATLVSYAAGSLPEAFEILVAHHLQQCPECQQRVAEAEALGGVMLESLEPIPLANEPDFEQLWGREVSPLPVSPAAMADDSLTDADPWLRKVEQPAPLEQLARDGVASLDWKWLVPGIQQIVMPTLEGTLRLLKIAPGISIPLHSHAGSEMTLVLDGSFTDELGRFQAGDVADLDEQTEHQPITDGNVPCICLVATDAPLRFNGLLPRILQPFTGF